MRHRVVRILFLLHACVLLLGFACGRGASKRTDQTHAGAIRGRVTGTSMATELPEHVIRCYRIHIHLESTAEGLNIDSLMRVGSTLVDSINAAVRHHFVSDTVRLNIDSLVRVHSRQVVIINGQIAIPDSMNWDDADDERGRFQRMETDGSFDAMDLPKGVYSIVLHELPCQDIVNYDEPLYPLAVIGVLVKDGMAAKVTVPPMGVDPRAPIVWKEAYEPL